MLSLPLVYRSVRGVIGVTKHLLLNDRPHLSPLTTAYFHLTHGHAAKVFIDRENSHAHSILEQSLKPYQIFRLDESQTTLATETKTTENTLNQLELPKLVLNGDNVVPTIEELVNAFTALTQYCIRTNTCISDERFTRFCKTFCKETHLLNDEQLLSILRLLAQLPEETSVRAPNYMDLWNNLDIECCRRIERWSMSELLLVCDAWYLLNLARPSDFVWEALCKVGRKIKRMKPEQLVQTMFYCNLVRRPLLDMIDLEVNLERDIDSMTLQELGVMSLGFFKTQTQIHNPELLESLYKRLMAEIETVDDITLVAILKVLRYSSKLPQVSHLMKLMEKLETQVSRISLLGCLHVALFGVELQCCHDGVLELVLHRFNRDLDMARLKDMERICLAISVFNYRSPTGVEQELCYKILNKLESKIDEIMQHPRSFYCCLHYLVLCGYHDNEILSSALNGRLIEHAYGKNLSLGREIFNLDSFVKINLYKDGYVGNQLPDKIRRKMGKVLTHYIPERNPKYKLNTTDRILMEIKETFEHILRPSKFKHILPHFERPDVVICYDNKQRKAIPIASSCPEDYSGDILTRNLLLSDAEGPEVDTLAIVIAGWNNVVKDKNRYTGLFEMKLRQLQILGHKPIVILWHEWRSLETPIDRQHFLKRKLANFINF